MVFLKASLLVHLFKYFKQLLNPFFSKRPIISRPFKQKARHKSATSNSFPKIKQSLLSRTVSKILRLFTTILLFSAISSSSSGVISTFWPICKPFFAAMDLKSLIEVVQSLSKELDQNTHCILSEFSRTLLEEVTVECGENVFNFWLKLSKKKPRMALDSKRMWLSPFILYCKHGTFPNG